MTKDAQGKTQIVKKQGLTALDGWFSVTEKNLPYELTVSLLLLASQPGVPHPIKLQEQHRPLFPTDQPITEDSGRRIAVWASGADLVKWGELDDEAALGKMRDAALGGMAPLRATWSSAPADLRERLKPHLEGLRVAAAKVDAPAAG